MATHRFDPLAVNVRALCEDGAELKGEWPLTGMTRLVESLFERPHDGGAVTWRAAGRLQPVTGGPPALWLQLQAEAGVTLQCQRCLQALQQRLQVDRPFRFVATEAEAEALDEVAEEDVLVLAPRLDLRELVEDELILALPIVPRHEGACPEPLPLAGGPPPEEAESRPNPFAVLAALKGKPQ